MRRAPGLLASALAGVFITASVCTAQVTDVFRDPRMDFGSIQTVAVVPFANLARDQVVAERVRDVFVNRLLSTEAVYVLPVGEVARGIAKLDAEMRGSAMKQALAAAAAFNWSDWAGISCCRGSRWRKAGPQPSRSGSAGTTR